jgi:hypothetical protein
MSWLLIPISLVFVPAGCSSTKSEAPSPPVRFTPDDWSEMESSGGGEACAEESESADLPIDDGACANNLMPLEVGNQ